MGFLQIRCISFDAQRFAVDFKGIYSVFVNTRRNKVKCLYYWIKFKVIILSNWFISSLDDC